MAGEAKDKRAVVLPLLLGFNGGYVDTMGFLALQGLFTAHVTGNFVTLGASLALGTSGALSKLLALPVFCAVVILSRLLSNALRHREAPVFRYLLTIKLVLLIAAAVLAVRLGPFPDGDHWAAIVTGMILVAERRAPRPSRQPAAFDADDGHHDPDHARPGRPDLRLVGRKYCRVTLALRADVGHGGRLRSRMRNGRAAPCADRCLVVCGAPARRVAVADRPRERDAMTTMSGQAAPETGSPLLRRPVQILRQRIDQMVEDAGRHLGRQ